MDTSQTKPKNRNHRRGGKKNKNKNKPQMKLRLAPVPGNMTCGAHSFILSLMAVALSNIKWFQSISDFFDMQLVRRFYDLNGTILGCGVRSHLLRELAVETVRNRGAGFFERLFGSDKWYWGPEVEANIIGRTDASDTDPADRSFLEHANPFFMVCAYLFDCSVRIIQDDGVTITFRSPNCRGPVITIRSSAKDNQLGGHFDSLIDARLGAEWSVDLERFREHGTAYTYNGRSYVDVRTNIESWYVHLGNLYCQVRHTMEKEKEIEHHSKPQHGSDGIRDVYIQQQRITEEANRTYLEQQRIADDARRVYLEQQRRADDAREIYSRALLQQQQIADAIEARRLQRLDEISADDHEVAERLFNDLNFK